MLRLGIIGRRYDNAIGTIIRGLYRLRRNAITDANTDPVVGFYPIAPYHTLSLLEINLDADGQDASYILT